MTVRELIEQLQQYPPDMELWTMGDDGYVEFPLSGAAIGKRSEIENGEIVEREVVVVS